MNDEQIDLLNGVDVSKDTLEGTDLTDEDDR